MQLNKDIIAARNVYKKYSNKYSLKVRYELMQNPKDNPKFVF